jgi:hypothetical protein
MQPDYKPQNVLSYERQNTSAIYKSTPENLNFHHNITDHHGQKQTKANLILNSAKSSENQAIEDSMQKKQYYKLDGQPKWCSG